MQLRIVIVLVFNLLLFCDMNPNNSDIKQGNLDTLDIKDCNHFDSLLSSLKDSINLGYLEISSECTNWLRIIRVPNLRKLTVYENTKLTDVTITKCPNLIEVYMPYNQYIKTITFDSIPNLERVSLYGYSTFKSLKGLSGSQKLKYLSLTGTMELSDLSFLDNLPSLNELDLYPSGAITDISHLSSLINLQRLHLDCYLFSSLTPIEKLTNIRYLLLMDANSIKSFDPLFKILGKGDTLVQNDMPDSIINRLRATGVFVSSL
jgi:hypothetical protein